MSRGRDCRGRGDCDVRDFGGGEPLKEDCNGDCDAHDFFGGVDSCNGDCDASDFVEVDSAARAAFWPATVAAFRASLASHP